MVATLQTMPQLPRALRPDDTYTHEDAGCTLIAEYVIHRWPTPEDAAEIEIIALQADFGGRNQVALHLSDLSGKRLLELEELIREEVEINARSHP